MSARHVALAGGCVLLVASGCSAATIDVASGAQAVLQADVRQLTQASATNNWPAARAAMDQLRTDLADALAAKQITASRAAAIRSDLAAVAADIPGRSAPAPTPTPTSSASTMTPPPPPKPKPGPPGKHHDKHGGDGGDNGGG